MKLIFGIIATTLSLGAFAQTETFCTIPTLKTEARNYLWADGARQERFLVKDSCLDKEISKVLSLQKKERSLESEKAAVLDVLATIKQGEMAGYMKCISTETPGCIDPDTEDGILEYEADLKRQNPIEGKDW